MNLYDDDMRMFRLAALRWRYPLSPGLIDRMVEWRNPRHVLEELRREHPDEHALLTEWLVLPQAADEDRDTPS